MWFCLFVCFWTTEIFSFRVLLAVLPGGHLTQIFSSVAVNVWPRLIKVPHLPENSCGRETGKWSSRSPSSPFQRLWERKDLFLAEYLGAKDPLNLNPQGRMREGGWGEFLIWNWEAFVHMEQSKVKPHREKGKALEPAKRFKGAYRHTHTYTHTHVHTHIYLFCVIFLERNLQLTYILHFTTFASLYLEVESLLVCPRWRLVQPRMNERWWYCLSFSRSDRRSVCFPGLGPFWRRQRKPIVFWVPDSHWKLHISSFSLWSSPALLGSGSGRRCWIWGRMTINRYLCRAWRRGQAPGTFLALQATWSFCPQCTVSLNGTFPVIMLRNGNTDFFGNHVRLPREVTTASDTQNLFFLLHSNNYLSSHW